MSNIEEREWNEDKAQTFASIYLLHQMDEGAQIPIILDKNYQFLEPLLEQLHSKGYIRIEESAYCLSEHGEEVLKRFYGRYREYLRLYDIFSAIDLETGEFAFAKYFDFESDETWYAYLENERWADLRIAVARLKKMDAHEIVFMSFLNEGRFGANENGWQFDLILGSIWQEIREICRNALTAEDIGSKERLVELTREGSQLMAQLLEHEQKLQKWQQEQQGGELAGEETEEIMEYEEYSRDPFYLSPLWTAPLFFL